MRAGTAQAVQASSATTLHCPAAQRPPSPPELLAWVRHHTQLEPQRRAILLQRYVLSKNGLQSQQLLPGFLSSQLRRRRRPPLFSFLRLLAHPQRCSGVQWGEAHALITVAAASGARLLLRRPARRAAACLGRRQVAGGGRAVPAKPWPCRWAAARRHRRRYAARLGRRWRPPSTFTGRTRVPPRSFFLGAARLEEFDRS